MPSQTYSIALPLADTRGLSPQRYRVAVVVDRTDDKPLSAKDVQAIEAALAGLTKATPAPAEKDAHAAALAAVEAAGRGSRKASKPAPKPARAASKGGASKAPSKPTKATRKASKTTARKAARRPAGG
jgi:hypothetical protein